MLHICHISTTFNLRSGSAHRTSVILTRCIAQGYKVSLLIGRDHDVRPEDLPGVDIYVIPELVKYISPRLDAIAPWRLRRILREIRPDLVHTHLAKAGIIGRLAAWSVGVPHILHTVHGPTFPQYFHPLKRNLFRILEKLCGWITCQFVFVGHDLRQEYIAAGVCTFRNSCVIQTGRPDAVFARSPLSATERKQMRLDICGGSVPHFLVVTVGRLVPAKQLAHGIRVIKELHAQDIQAHLAVVGKSLLREERKHEQKLIRLSRELALADYVHFCGFRTDIIKVMESADAILLTSHYEGLPNVAVEAVISGTPMVAYDVSGIREVLQEGVTGWIVPQGDIGRIVQILSQLSLDDRVDRQVRPTQPRDEGLLRNFRESVMVARKMKLYAEILALGDPHKQAVEL